MLATGYCALNGNTWQNIRNGRWRNNESMSRWTSGLNHSFDSNFGWFSIGIERFWAAWQLTTVFTHWFSLQRIGSRWRYCMRSNDVGQSNSSDALDVSAAIWKSEKIISLCMFRMSITFLSIPQTWAYRQWQWTIVTNRMSFQNRTSYKSHLLTSYEIHCQYISRRKSIYFFQNLHISHHTHTINTAKPSQAEP